MNEIEPGRKRVTLRDVAQEAGVSLKTASNVINNAGRMSDETRAGSDTGSTCRRAI